MLSQNNNLLLVSVSGLVLCGLLFSGSVLEFWMLLEALSLSTIPLMLSWEKESGVWVVSYFVLKVLGGFSVLLGLWSGLGGWVVGGLLVKAGLAPCFWAFFFLSLSAPVWLVAMMVSLLKLPPMLLSWWGWWGWQALVSLLSMGWVSSMFIYLGGVWGKEMESRALLAGSSMFDSGFVVTLLGVSENLGWSYFWVYSSNLVLFIFSLSVYGGKGALGVVSLGGFPPLVGFFLKMEVLKAMGYGMGFALMIFFSLNILLYFLFLPYFLNWNEGSAMWLGLASFQWAWWGF